MAYREINRSSPNDGLGDDSRTWSGKTNENMKELFSRNLAIGSTLVRRISYDPNNTSFTAYLDNDKVEGWAVIGQRYVEGVILDATGFTWPTDIDNETKFFITNDVEN